MHGFLLIDKEKGKTSFDIVKFFKDLTRERHVGHAGTLDPLASGLLILAFGEGTKLLEFLIGSDKEYEAEACFGKISDTYDADGKISVIDEKIYFDEEDISEVIKKNFIGDINQTPPQFSALKVKGRRAYEFARKGVKVELKPRSVKIFRFNVKEFDWPKVVFSVKCSSGTYIRSLIHELGMKLKCGAYVENLRRIKIGEFSVGMAKKPDYYFNKPLLVEKNLISLEEIGRKFVCVDISSSEYEILKNGGILAGEKIDQKQVNMAYLDGYLAGVLEMSKNLNGIKFRKMIVR